MSDHDFCRELLTATMILVREHTTVEQRRDAWAIKVINQNEFHGPDGFYHHSRSCCLWCARVDGWNAWLNQLPHHITINGTPLCEYAGHMAGQDKLRAAGMNQCTHPSEIDALIAIDKIGPQFDGFKLEAVVGDCPTTEENICPDCDGSGSAVSDIDLEGPGGEFIPHTDCERCKGNGRVANDRS